VRGSYENFINVTLGKVLRDFFFGYGREVITPPRALLWFILWGIFSTLRWGCTSSCTTSLAVPGRMFVLPDNTIVKFHAWYLRFSKGQWWIIATFFQPKLNSNVGAYVQEFSGEPYPTLIDACTALLMEMRPDLRSLLEWIRNTVVSRNPTKNDPLCDVYVWRHGHWISAFQLELQHHAKFCPTLPDNTLMQRGRHNAVYLKDQPIAIFGSKKFGMLFRNIKLQFPGYHFWIPLQELLTVLPKLFHVKVKDASTQITRIVVLFPDATVRHFIDMVMDQFEIVDISLFDFIMVGARGVLDLSDKNIPLAQFGIGRYPAFTLQNKDLRGKISGGFTTKKRKNKQSDDNNNTKNKNKNKNKNKTKTTMTMSELINEQRRKRRKRKRRKRGGEYSLDDDSDDDDSDDDDSDDDSDDDDVQNKKHNKKQNTVYKDDLEDEVISEDEVIPKKLRPPVLQKAVDNNLVAPFFEILPNGFIRVGLTVQKDSLDIILPEAFTPQGWDLVDKQRKLEVKRLRQTTAKKK